jgi:hypothetical protein
MDLLGHLLGSEGCNVDGSIGNNPFTSLVDHVFDSSFADIGGQMPADNAVFVEESMSMYQGGPQQVLRVTGNGYSKTVTPSLLHNVQAPVYQQQPNFMPQPNMMAGGYEHQGSFMMHPAHIQVIPQTGRDLSRF